jgi:hypothetical protein
MLESCGLITCQQLRLAGAVVIDGSNERRIFRIVETADRKAELFAHNVYPVRIPLPLAKTGSPTHSALPISRQILQGPN